MASLSLLQRSRWQGSADQALILGGVLIAEGGRGEDRMGVSRLSAR
jgi:hypothetical protein